MSPRMRAALGAAIALLYIAARIGPPPKRAPKPQITPWHPELGRKATGEPLWRWYRRITWVVGWRLAVVALRLWSISQMHHSFTGGWGCPRRGFVSLSGGG